MVSSPLPRRKSVSLRFAHLKTVAAALLLAAASLGLSGCPGDLDPRLMGGGTTTCPGPNVCNGEAFMKGAKCSMAGCHYNVTPAAGLDLYSDGVITRLVGRMPDPAMSQSCMTSTMPYIAQGSDPVMGLLLDKLKMTPSCGLAMPYPGLELLPASDIACLTEWAQAVAKCETTP
jgi:hypothetical protein